MAGASSRRTKDICTSSYLRGALGKIRRCSLRNWHSYNIHLGPEVDRTDWMVGERLATLGSEQQVPWFFLRYTDTRGPHIRFRIGGSASRQVVDDALSDAVALAPLVPRTPVARLISTGREFTAPADLPRGIFRQDYRPELEKYVNEAGASLAEDSFCACSALVADLISADEGAGENKKRAAIFVLVRLFVRLQQQFPGHNLSETYAGFALREAGMESLHTKLLAGANAQRDRTAELMATPALPDASWPRLHAFEASVNSLWTGYRANGLFRDLEHESIIAFDILHLTANRFGLTFLDEAYVALLSASLGPQGVQLASSASA